MDVEKPVGVGVSLDITAVDVATSFYTAGNSGTLYAALSGDTAVYGVTGSVTAGGNVSLYVVARNTVA